MAYGDEKVVVNVKDTDHGEILYTDNEGAEHTYYPSNNVWVVVQTLEVITVLGETKEEGHVPLLVTRVRGTVELDDRSISVVGDPKSKVRNLTIHFEAGDWRPKPDKATDDDTLSLITDLGGARLGFLRGDWEIGNDDHWWIECYLPKLFIDALVVDIRSGQIDGMRLSLALRGLYTSDSSWVPISSRGDLFIRPDRKDNTIAMPDMAIGHVKTISFTSTPRDFRKPAPVEPEDPDFEITPPLAPAPDPVAIAIATLSDRVDQLRTTLKWVGGFIVLALFFVAGR